MSQQGNGECLLCAQKRNAVCLYRRQSGRKRSEAEFCRFVCQCYKRSESGKSSKGEKVGALLDWSEVVGEVGEFFVRPPGGAAAL